ncbi:MAG: hypothetical protein RIQ94_2361, partial [Pseudomonadota bacterium]
LSHMYAKGLGVTQSYVRAHMWASRAVEQGDLSAEPMRDFCALKMR